MIRKHAAFKYEALFKGPYEIFQTCTNVTFTLQIGEFMQRINIRRIKIYYITDVA